ncbi:hypothetical protein [Nocardioides sp.]|uniref:hypothetical protein n=1 Tax=Nocardioides sp. TaxID=35761 RepID=UPI0026355319|nr:hypothetical protein [Nocardioides sp.]
MIERIHRSATLGASAVAVLALTAACGSEAATSPAPSASPTSGSVSTSPSGTADPGAISPTDLASVPTLQGARGAISDLAGQQCNVGSGHQVARAEITSSATGTADYLVTVSWTTNAGDVLARGYDRLAGVAAGEQRKVTIKAKVPAGARRCVWGVERAQAK